MPNSKTLVDTTQRLLPVKLRAEPVKEAMEEEVEEIFPRVEGGIMSTSAATRSRRDSEDWRSCSEATDEISESRGRRLCQCMVGFLELRLDRVRTSG
jgi:hypothetical protein